MNGMRWGVLGVVLAGLWASAACTGSTDGGPSARPAAPPPGEAWTTTTLRTQSGRYSVVLALDPPEPALGSLFAIDAVVMDARSDTPLEGAILRLDARMPHHGHGMMTRPIDLPGVCEDGATGPCPHPEGRFRSEGFKLHMPGSWTILVEVEGPRGLDTTSVVYEQPAAR